MKPIAMAEKAGSGELMIVHECAGCKAVQPNRVAGDDNPLALEALMLKTFAMGNDEREQLNARGIVVVVRENEHSVRRGLFGEDGLDGEPVTT